MSSRDRDAFLAELLEQGLTEAEAMELLALAVAPVDPPPALRDRIVATLASGGRLERFAEAVARLLDVGADKARALLDGIDRAESFAMGLMEGMESYSVEGGPAVAGSITGFIRIKPGTTFPHHVHVGREHVLVVTGRLRDSDGVELGPGDEKVMEPGTAHSFVVLDGPDLVYLAVVADGIEVNGQRIGPDDPRI
jgi:anti-sigma factor ChrR (cupin superfamily)